MCDRYQASPPIQIVREKHPEGKDDVFLCAPDVCEECSVQLFESQLEKKATGLKHAKIWIDVPLPAGRNGAPRSTLIMAQVSGFFIDLTGFCCSQTNFRHSRWW